MDKDDTNDLDAALVELVTRRRAHGDVDPETRALLARAEVQRAMVARRDIEASPDPLAPQPVEMAGDAGPLLVQAEAAAMYVAPVEVMLPDAPRLPSGPVRIDAAVDPRRAKTVKVVPIAAKKEDEGAAANAPAPDGRIAPAAAAIEPSASSRGRRRGMRATGPAQEAARRRLWPVVLVSGGVFAAVVAVGLVLRGPKAKGDSEPAAAATTSSPAIAESLTTLTSATCTSVGHPPCPTVTVSEAATATASAPAAKATAALSTASSKGAAVANDEVYPDAATPGQRAPHAPGAQMPAIATTEPTAHGAGVTPEATATTMPTTPSTPKPSATSFGSQLDDH